MSSVTTVFKAYLLYFILLSLSSCGDAGIGGGGDITEVSVVPSSGNESVIISGKVSLSASSLLETSSKNTGPVAPSGKPGSKMYMSTRQSVVAQKGADFLSLNKEVNSASVFLYDADHPEWLYPVAAASTNTIGDYTLNILSNAEFNLDGNGNTLYVNGDPIPEGKYTLLAFRPGGFDPVLGVTTDPVVAIQSVVNTFAAGVVSTADLVAQSSTVKPIVETMFGVRKNTDGTQTWTGPTDLSTNSSIQVTFSMAMSRASILNGISISPEVAGSWTVSADWTSATFYPDSTSGLTAGAYTVTVNGENGTGFPVTNVYGNALAKTAVGSFTVTASTDTTVPVVTLESPVASTGVDIVTPIRVRSNEVLDINSLSITSSPSLGVKPGVLYVGKNSSNQYIYEFVLAKPLALATSYSLNISGGTDMAGNVMAPVPVSFTTVSSVGGVDSTADSATQAVQSDVLDVFGRWVRAFNDRSLRQLQSMMSGDYVFEYDVNQHGPNDEDLNRDGRLSLQEFNTMIAEGFKNWEYCETSVTGNVIGNVNVVGSTANFEFSLTFAATNTSRDCTDDSPNALYATASNINGTWLISRVSEGIDTRNKVLKPRTLLSGLAMTQSGVPIGSEAVGNLNGSTLIVLPQRDGAGVVDYPVSFSWKAVEGATAYVFYILNARDEDRGRAFILPASYTSWKMPRDRDPSGNPILPAGVIDVQKLFGFWNEQGIGMVREGEEFYWTVMALDNNVPSDFDVDGNGEYDPENSNDESRATSLFQQISAVSRQYRFKNPGVYKEITFSIASPTYGPLTFNEWYDGYDAIDDANINLVINTPNIDNSNAWVNVNGHSWKQIPFSIVAGTATVPVLLFEGFNWIEIFDGVDLYKYFSVQTTGGIAPYLTFTSITDDQVVAVEYINLADPANDLVDEWGYLNTGGADIKSLVIKGIWSDTLLTSPPSTANININLWNESGANNSQNITVTDGVEFTIQLPVYAGNNWINFSAYYCDTVVTSNCNQLNSHLGVNTPTGTVWVPPIKITSVVNAVLTENYGNGQNWDASNDTDNKVTISGVMDNVNAVANYSISSDGAWFNKSLSVNFDGSFQIPVELYKGWNYVDIYDTDGNWFNVSIYTANGLPVYRPKILTYTNSTATVNYNNSGNISTDVCTVTLAGLALADSIVEVVWNAGDAVAGYNDRQFVEVGPDDDNDGLGSFIVDVNLINSLNSYNNIDIFDKNYRGTFVQLNSSSVSSCAFTDPVLTLSSVDGDATTSAPAGSPYDAGISTTATITGVTEPNRSVVMTNWICGGTEKVIARADISGNFVITGAVYDGYNQLEITDGFNYPYQIVNTTNGLYPQEKLTANVVGETALQPVYCGYSQYDLSAQGTAVTTVDIAGSTVAADGTGTYWDADGVMGTFNILNGTFTIPGITVYDGWNYISIEDTDFNHYNVDVLTANTVIKPRKVEIISPLHDDTILASTSPILVQGTIADTGIFPADRVNAYVYDENTGSVEYSSDLYDQTAYGKSPITFDPVSGDFSFSVNVSSDTKYVQISVDAGDDQTGEWHGHWITINNQYNYSEYSYKQGSIESVITKGGAVVAPGEAVISKSAEAQAKRSLIRARRRY